MRHNDQHHQERLDSILAHFSSESDIDEVLINGAQVLVTCSAAGSYELQPTPFADNGDLVTWLQLFAYAQGARLDPLNPAVGGMLHHGAFRWHCVIPPVAADGPLLSIRRHRFTALGLDAIVPDVKMRRALGSLAERGQPLLIAGPTASGKTSLLSAIIGAHAQNERVVLVERTPELSLLSPLWVRLVESPPNLEGQGRFSLKQVIQEVLRLRPDRIVVGEIRGDEAVALLHAATSGHMGWMATIHAGSVDDVFDRLAMFASGPLHERLISQLSCHVLMMSRSPKPHLEAVLKVDGTGSPRQSRL